MIRTLLAALVLATGLTLSATDARADAWLYVRDGIYLNARIGPGTRYRTHHVLSPGTRVQIIARLGNWAQVRTPDGLLLWVFFSYLMDQPPHYIVRPAPPPIIVVPRPTRPYHPVPQPPRVQPRPQPQPWVQPQPRPQPWVQPHPQPRVQPKPQPKVQPKVQPRPQPKVQPQPRQQPRPQQQGGYDQNEILRITPDGRIIYKGR